MRCQLAEYIEVDIEVAAPETSHSAPDVSGETRAGDAVEDAGDRAPRQSMFAAIERDEVAYVCPAAAQAARDLQQEMFLKFWAQTKDIQVLIKSNQIKFYLVTHNTYYVHFITSVVTEEIL